MSRPDRPKRGRSFDLNPEQEEALRHRAKAELRKRFRAVRGAVPRESRQARSAKLCAHLTASDAWQNATLVAGYVAMGSEADPAKALAERQAAGQSYALPAMDWDADEVIFREADGSPLEESGLGFLQPPESAPQVAFGQIDLVLVPALAIDDRGFRLGWGKGYYDRLLPRLPNALAIALVFDFQLLAELPHTSADVPVPTTVTDAGVRQNF
ncbi:MAG: 5-formyltetrahydrofolate cyclo-ligase [Myxococcota bacterium]